MALGTFGTNATSTLSAKAFSKAMLPADVAALANNILDDVNPSHPIWPGAFARTGLLYIPNRGLLQVRDGDYIAYGGTGWPILVSAAEVANGWTFVP